MCIRFGICTLSINISLYTNLLMLIIEGWIYILIYLLLECYKNTKEFQKIYGKSKRYITNLQPR